MNEDDFHEMLDARFDDFQTLLVFADWLQEHGDPRADGYRAMGKFRRRCVRMVYAGGSHGFRVCDASANMEPRGCEDVPRKWFALAEAFGSEGYILGYRIKYWTTRRGADDALALGYVRLSPGERDEVDRECALVDDLK